MTWFFGIVVVLVLGGIAAVAAGRGGVMPDDDRDLPPSRVPDVGPLTAEHLRHVRFPLALRGYRMADVDALLSRLASQLEEGDRDRSETEEAAVESAGESAKESGRPTARDERSDAT